MTTEQLLIAFIFNALIFMQVGRILTEQRIARKTVEAITALYNSEWYPPQVLAAQLIHVDQDMAPEVGPLVLSLTTQCRLIHSSVRAR